MKEGIIDIKQPKRLYFSKDFGLENCPECGNSIIEYSCTVVLHLTCGKEEESTFTNALGSKFCKDCPVIVLDSDKIEETAKYIFRSKETIGIFVKGVIDFDQIPANKKNKPLGTDENPIPVISFYA